MRIFSLAFDGIAWIGSFVIVHYLISFFQKDPTNISFGQSITIAVVPSFVIYYGLPLADSLLSFRAAIILAIAVVFAWKMADLFTVLAWWEDWIVGIVAVGAYLALYYGAHRLLGYVLQS